ncbi:MAG: hypothetical protein A2103_02535 [Gammaproteobacteria bacterium GWF2_41_13]|nr:MAG: hypothetical protein A2103_02535 [Gammaproteobacteria bacterium GWF2_41_13]
MQSVLCQSPETFLDVFQQLTNQEDKNQFLKAFAKTKLTAQDFYAFFKDERDPSTIRDARFWIMNGIIMLRALEKLTESIQTTEEFLLIFNFFLLTQTDEYTTKVLSKSKTRMMDTLTEQQLETVALTIKNDHDFLDVLVTLDGYPFKQATVAEIFDTKIKTIDQLESLFKKLFEYDLPVKQSTELVKLIFNSLRENILTELTSNGGKLALFLEKFNAKQSSIIFEGLPTGYLVFAFFGKKTQLRLPCRMRHI